MDLKLHLFHNLRHLGEVRVSLFLLCEVKTVADETREQKDWIFFADHIKAQLPYVWRTREDTSMSSDYFRRERSFGKIQGDDDDGGSWSLFSLSYQVGKRGTDREGH